MDIQNLRIIPNATGQTQDGLDPYSTEIIVYGGTLREIAETLKETMAITDLLRLQNGVHGDPESFVVESDVLDEDIEVRISRPITVNLTMEVDIVHDENYVGDNEIRDNITEYIGGQKTTGDISMGTGVGVPVYLDKVESYITNANDGDSGVIGISNISIDVDGDGTDDQTTDANGLEIIDIAENEVASIDDALFDITINTTEA